MIFCTNCFWRFWWLLFDSGNGVTVNVRNIQTPNFNIRLTPSTYIISFVANKIG